MAQESILMAKKRETSGSGAAGRLRKTGWLPCVVSNEHGQSQSIQLPHHAFEMMLRRHTSQNLILDLQVEGEKVRKVLLKEVQYNPLTDAARHADFVEISMTKKVRIRIPIVLIGEPVGVTQEGGILEQSLREVEVECLPKDLVEKFEVNVAELKIGGHIQVAAMSLPACFTVLTAGDVTVALVSAPRAEEEVVAEAAVAEGAEPEVIEKGKEVAEGEEAGEEGEKKGGKEEGAKKGKEEEKKGGKEEGAKKGKEEGKKGKEGAPAAPKK